MHQVLEQTIPELEVVDPNIGNQDPEKSIPVIDRVLTRTAESGQQQKFVVPPQLAAGAKRKKRHRRREKSSRSGSQNAKKESVARDPRVTTSTVDVTPDSVSGSSETTSAASSAPSRQNSSFQKSGNGPTRPQPTTHRPSQRNHQRRHRHHDGPISRPSPVTEFLKIVLGGALAFPIAYLMILWVFGQDPLSLGPPISNVAPWAVPDGLQQGADETENDELIIEAPDTDEPLKAPGDVSVSGTETDHESLVPSGDLDPLINPKLNE